MKVVFLNKSDLRGGAAIVTMRLMLELRKKGVDARMIVCEKLSTLPEVAVAAPAWRARIPFLAERLKIYMANGFNRTDLFKVDTAADGLPLWRHPWVKEADVVCINWVNQGMLSLAGIEKMVMMGKPVVWTMHDMWCMTGICHHAGVCRHYLHQCGDCPLLGRNASPDDISNDVWKRKSRLYGHAKIRFVAVSNWLAECARCSSLMKDADLRVIHNAFPVNDDVIADKPSGNTGIVFGAARLDDPVKGLPIFVEALDIINRRDPEIAAGISVETYGDIRDASWLERIPVSHKHLGVLRGEEAIRDVYRRNSIVVSSSLYETLPGTLIEGQAYGCVPVCFDRGGQGDIVVHGHTGYLASLPDDIGEADVFRMSEDQVRASAHALAEGIIWAVGNQSARLRRDMHRSLRLRFSGATIADKYIDLFKEISK